MNEALHALETGARLGYLARAVVYFMIGTLALMAGLGYGGETEDPKDALRDLFRQPFGEVLVIAAAAGLAGYGLWRLLMAVRDPEHALYADEGRAQRIGRRLGYVGSGLANLSLAAFALSLQFPRLVPFGHGGSGDGTRDWTARLLRVPAGEWLVAGVGVVFLITAAVFAVRAWKAGFCKTLAPEAQRPLIVNLCRIGIGAQPAVDRLLKPNIGSELAGPMAAPQAHLEPVSHMWVTKFLRTHGLVHDCPKLVVLKSYPTIAIGGDAERSRGLLAAMICHLAVFHPPDMLQIRVLTDDIDDPDWTWLKWLPHVQSQTEFDDAGPKRLVFTKPDGLADLTARGPHSADAPPSGPYVLVVDLTGGKAGFPVDGRAGVTVITKGNHKSGYRIKVNPDGSCEDRTANQPWREVTTVTDSVTPTSAGRLARKLAGWSITGAGAAGSTPASRSTRARELRVTLPSSS